MTRPDSPEGLQEGCSAALNLLEDLLPLVVVSEPSYASVACEQLKRILTKVRKLQAALAEEELPGQRPLFETSHSAATLESPGEPTPLAPEGG